MLGILHIHVHMEPFTRHILGIYWVYTTDIYGIYSFTGFRGQHHSRPVPVPQDVCYIRSKYVVYNKLE